MKFSRYNWLFSLLFITGLHAQVADKFYGGSNDGSASAVSSSALAFPYVQVSVKCFLEGPYDAAGDSMITALCDNGYIPLTSPYTEDARTVSSIPEDVVDWVLVELRLTKNTASVAFRSAFLHKNGLVVADDGTTNTIVMDVPDESYYIVVKHRNHLAIIANQTAALTAASTTLQDYTTSQASVSGNSMAILEEGVFGLYGGDCDNDGGVVFASEVTLVREQNLLDGYQAADVNLDGAVVFATELVLIRLNNLLGSAVQN